VTKKIERVSILGKFLCELYEIVYES